LYGEGAAPATEPGVRESRWLLAGPAALALGAIALGVVIPGPLQDLLARAASALGGSAP
jgi:uncharacterized membrane protein